MAVMVLIAMPTVMTEAGHQTPASLLRLFQLVSPALPIGAYTYSQGLEYAVDTGWVSNEQEVQKWILGQLDHALPNLDIPLLARMYTALSNDNWDAWIDWNRYLQASRESGELLAEDRHLGQALAQLFEQLEGESLAQRIPRSEMTFAGCYACACVRWSIPLESAAWGYLWIWAEGQVAAAIKLVPLGQTAGQRILSRVIDHIPVAVGQGLSIDDDEIGRAAPALGIASALHETQYSRLFRS